jgi:hypothetical protein
MHRSKNGSLFGRYDKLPKGQFYCLLMLQGRFKARLMRPQLAPLG